MAEVRGDLLCVGPAGWIRPSDLALRRRARYLTALRLDMGFAGAPDAVGGRRLRLMG